MGMSLDAFDRWAQRQGAVGNPQVNTYRGQCVSLVQQYLWHCYGLPYKPRGNAAQFVPPKFYRVGAGAKYVPGDILRYGTNYGGGYGHIGLIAADGKFLDQNGTKRLAVGVRATPFAGYTVFRPEKRCPLYDAAPKPSAPANGGRVAQNGTFIASVNRNIRRAPSLSGRIVAVFSAGARQKYDSYIDRDGFRWVSWIGASGYRNYVTVRRLSDGKCYGEYKPTKQ